MLHLQPILAVEVSWRTIVVNTEHKFSPSHHICPTPDHVERAASTPRDFSFALVKAKREIFLVQRSYKTDSPSTIKPKENIA